jgi:simple sugar transport system permease protein
LWFFGNTLDSIALLLTASLGALFAFKGGLFNLGGEGQIYLGGLAAAADLQVPHPQSGPVILPLAAAAALCTGGLMGGVSGFLNEKFNIIELITSFLLSAALSPVADYIISGPFRDGSGNLLASPRIEAARRLPLLLPPSGLSLSFPVILVLILAVYMFIQQSGAGYRYRIAGAAPVFARFGGIRVSRLWTPALFASGAIHGLTGFFAVAGTYGMCHLGFSGGLGWSALAVALIGGSHPLGIIPAALVFGWFKAGSDTALLASSLDLETSSFIQAIVLLLATVQFRLFPPDKIKSPLSKKREASGHD